MSIIKNLFSSIYNKSLKFFKSTLGKITIYIFIGILLVVSHGIFTENEFIFFTKMYVFFVLLKFLLFIRDKLNKNEIENNLKYVRKNNYKKQEIFTWMGEEKYIDKIIYEIVGDMVEDQNTLITIKNLKKKIMDKFEGDLNDYYLIREIIINEKKQSFGNFTKTLFTTLLLSSIGVTLFNAFMNKDIMNKIFEALDLDIYFAKNPDLFLIIIDIGFYFLLLLVFMSIIFNVISKSKRRMGLFLIVIDEIIKELENKKLTI